MNLPPVRKTIPFPRTGVETPLAANRRIDSWKEIATYLNRGARTVQRWEREEGLPVHRLQHEKLGSVYAYTGELDAWWESRRQTLDNELPPLAEQEGSVAVLPFADMSQERDQEYFCDGMAEEIITALNRVRGLRVASRISSFRFKGSGAGAHEIGRKLRAASLLEGSVRKSGDRLRITVQLTDTEDGYPLWSETYDRRTGDVFAIQEEIARSVALALEVTLGAGEKEPLVHVPTSDIEAYDLYLRGRTAYYHYGPSDVGEAIGLFRQAVERDPGYVLAHAGLADCYSYLYLNAERSAANLEQAELASRRAVELDPNSAQAQASRALALSLNRRDAEAEVAFEKAIHRDPNLFEAHYFYARHAFAKGQREKAAALYEAATRIRPEDYQSPLLVAQTYDHLGRFEDARAARLRGIDLAWQHLKVHPDDARAIYMAANGMAALGDNARAGEWAARALALRPADPMLLYNVGCIYSMLGHLDKALDTLESAYDHGLRHKNWYEQDDNLDPLRQHPRFQALLRLL
jgi:TolB-like protein/Flp pilus assembly protein TadD